MCMARTKTGQQCKRVSHICFCDIHSKELITNNVNEFRWYGQRYKQLWKKIQQGLISFEDFHNHHLPTLDLKKRKVNMSWREQRVNV